MVKKGCILILAKFKFGDLELYLWCNCSAFSMWRMLARQNWEWRLLTLTAVFKATMFLKVQGKNWTACKKGQTPRILTLWLWYVRRSVVIGHVPRKMSAYCALFLRRRGTIWHDQHSSTELELSRKIQSRASPRARACTYVHVRLVRIRHVYY